MVALLLIGGLGGAALALVFILGLDALIRGIHGPRLPWVVMALAVGLVLLAVVWGVARVAALR